MMILSFFSVNLRCLSVFCSVIFMEVVFGIDVVIFLSVCFCMICKVIMKVLCLFWWNMWKWFESFRKRDAGMRIEGFFVDLVMFFIVDCLIMVNVWLFVVRYMFNGYCMCFFILLFCNMYIVCSSNSFSRCKKCKFVADKKKYCWNVFIGMIFCGFIKLFGGYDGLFVDEIILNMGLVFFSCW